MLEFGYGRRDLDGVERKYLFPANKQAKIIQKINEWFEHSKEDFPEWGFFIPANRFRPDGSPLKSLSEISDSFDLPKAVTFPLEMIKLFDAILHDSAQDREFANRNIKFLLERTGNLNTHPDDQDYHVDTKETYWDEKGNRIGYDSRRSLDKYLVFVGRPGTLVIHGRIDPTLNHQEGFKLGMSYQLDPESGQTIAKNGMPDPKVLQLLPDSIYRVAVGDILHRPPFHSDSLLITAWFND